MNAGRKDAEIRIENAEEQVMMSTKLQHLHVSVYVGPHEYLFGWFELPSAVLARAAQLASTDGIKALGL